MRQPPDTIKIPYSTYQNLLDHLQIHASTDGWAASVLKELEEESQPIFTLPSCLTFHAKVN